MDHDPRSFLYDVRQSADTVSRFLQGVSENEYLRNDMIRAAVERHLEIIGEAMARLARGSPEIAARIPDQARIIGLRNLLIHGYRIVDSTAVWRITQLDLPKLRQLVAVLLLELKVDPEPPEQKR